MVVCVAWLDRSRAIRVGGRDASELSTLLRPDIYSAPAVPPSRTHLQNPTPEILWTYAKIDPRRQAGYSEGWRTGHVSHTHIVRSRVTQRIIWLSIPRTSRPHPRRLFFCFVWVGPHPPSPGDRCWVKFWPLLFSNGSTKLK